ncbi:MAG TPA: ABC transporter substrate binding protein [Candidatus Polarisedimenticolaceae bacterium]|nr:ABC transporter substrate binding protein [Candidatus Polarisedimenticolaceae bacterium]
MKLARAAALALALLLEPAGRALSSSPGALVVVSPGPEAYRTAGDAARRSIDEGGVPAEVVVLEDAAAEKRVAERLAASGNVALAVGARAARFVRAQAPDARLVYAMLLDPEALGLPGPGDAPKKNMTGVTMDVDPAAQLEVLKTLAPEVKRIGVLYDPAISGAAVRKAQAIARSKGFEVVAQAVRGEGEVLSAATLLVSSVDALWGIADSTVLTAANARALILLALRSHKPLLALSESFVRTGALAALAADPAEVGRAAGTMAASLAKNEQQQAPSPIGPPRLDLFLNKATAEHIGVAVPPQLAAKASAVYPTP